MAFRPPRRRITGLAVAVALSVVGWGAQPVSARPRTDASTNPAARMIAPDDLARLMQEGDVIVIDVRPSHLYQRGHLPDAVSIPLDRVEKALTGLRASHARIVLYCNGPAGTKSGRAAALLRGHGIDRVYCLDGGFDAWMNSGRVVFVDPTDM